LGDQTLLDLLSEISGLRVIKFIGAIMVFGLDLSEFFVEKSFLATALAHIEG
jgi:hypothetical protein